MLLKHQNTKESLNEALLAHILDPESTLGIVGLYIKVEVSWRPYVRPRYALCEHIRVGLVHLHQGGASVECPAFLEHNPHRHCSRKALPRKSDQGSFTSRWQFGQVALWVQRCFSESRKCNIN